MWNDIPADELKQLMDKIDANRTPPGRGGTGALARKPILLARISHVGERERVTAKN